MRSSSSVVAAEGTNLVFSVTKRDLNVRQVPQQILKRLSAKLNRSYGNRVSFPQSYVRRCASSARGVVVTQASGERETRQYPDQYSDYNYGPADYGYGAPPPPPPPPDRRPPGGGGRPPPINTALVAGAFVMGIGAGVFFDYTANFEPDNVASSEIIDRQTPNSEVCFANGTSAMVFDERIFVSLNPFNVYVSQPEVKPGCVLRRSNWSVLEKRKLLDKAEVQSCRSNMNTFAFVGDLEKAPEISCVYHSEEAENQFMVDPKSAMLGDGVQRKTRDFK
ncbi:hypothetical protein CYMTET_20724 [Cymbomonas tetramitiformis]|uniref:DUF3172 domain-containing protein n=1 Tax=Cymbomonas tetramitiformis TaxID=36881 RepID=A0AAE0G3H0_9CHLO|nr:hypothetical protein CYMTET_20724 [Cymbomonas tetramitiformis]